MAISAGGVAVTVVGGLMVYSGLSNATPLTALHGLLTGQPVSIDNGASSVLTSVNSSSTAQGSPIGATLTNAQAAVSAGQNSATSNQGAAIVAGAMQYKGDLYSENINLRNETGYSDCSSFVSKALLAAGITPCNWHYGQNFPSTLSYAAWSGLKGIPASSAQPGDILLSPGVHMAIVTGPNTAIGQENPRRNVQEGSWSSIMAGTGTYGVYRVVA